MSSSVTKEKILEAAEWLFAEHGFESTSLRDITSRAEVNLAAVNYHFGSKNALLEELFDRRLSRLNQERLHMLEAATTDMAKSKRQLVEAIVRAFVLPPIRKTRQWNLDGRAFLRFMGTAHFGASETVRVIFFTQMSEVAARFVAALQAALSPLPADEVRRRFDFMVGAMAHTLVWKHEQLRASATRGGECDDAPFVTESLVRFCVAGCLQFEDATPPRAAL